MVGLPDLFNQFVAALGLPVIWNSSLDVKLLVLQRFIRLFAYGTSTIILVAYLRALGIPEARIGLFMTLTLAGDVMISFILILFADRLGRRAVLMAGSCLMGLGGIVFALCSNFWLLLSASVMGVISPNGNEIGPFAPLELSMIAHLTRCELHTYIYAWHSLLGLLGSAIGIITCGWLVTFLQKELSWDFVQACRCVFWIYTGLGCIKFCTAAIMSKKVELERQERLDSSRTREQTPLLEEQGERVEEIPEARCETVTNLLTSNLAGIVVWLCLLFGVDSFASGLASLSWLTYYFRTKFSLTESTLGNIFFTTGIISAASTLLAPPLAERIGNVKTMVLTHLPSTIMLCLIPFQSASWLAITFLFLRSSTASMDVAPRTAFLAAVLPAEHRTAIMGVTNMIKTCAATAAPFVTGALAERGIRSFGWAISLAGSLKMVYDIGIIVRFGRPAGENTTRERDLETEAGDDRNEHD